MTDKQKKQEQWEIEFDQKFVIPNGHFHDFYYEEHPYKKELWSNYIQEPGLDKLKQFIAKVEQRARQEAIEEYKKELDKLWISPPWSAEWHDEVMKIEGYRRAIRDIQALSLQDKQDE